MIIQTKDSLFRKVFPVTRTVMPCLRARHHFLAKQTMVPRTGLPTMIDHNLNLPTIFSPRIKPLLVALMSS